MTHDSSSTHDKDSSMDAVRLNSTFLPSDHKEPQKNRFNLRSLLGLDGSHRHAPNRHALKLHDNSEIVVWEWPAMRKSGLWRKHLVDRKDIQENVVFCVHGLTRNGKDFDALAQMLRRPRAGQIGRCVMAVDIVGRGQSSWLSNKILYSYATYHAHLVEILDRLQLPQVDWVGTSMGGILGMTMAATMPHRVGKLVLNDVGAVVSRRGLARIGDYVKQTAKNQPHFDNRGDAKRWLKEIMTGYGNLSIQEWRASLRVMTQTSLDSNGNLIYVPAFDPALGENFDIPKQDVELWHLWKNVKQPVLLIRGAKSDIIDAEIAKLMAERAGVTLVTLPGRGHAPTLVPGSQTQIIRDWLRGV